MQQPKGTHHPAGIIRGRILVVSMSLVIVISGALLLSLSSSAPLGHSSSLSQKPAHSETMFPDHSFIWDEETRTTAPTFDFSPNTSVAQQVRVSPLFNDYYTRHSGATSLGAVLTPAFPTGSGWLQFFASGALLLPAVQHVPIHDPDDPQPPRLWTALIDGATRDPGTGILCLPLLQALLRVGSEEPVVEGSLVTYADLRASAAPTLMLKAPTDNRPGATPSLIGSQNIYIQAGTRSGEAVGHLVPLPIWSYIQRADVSPDGWETDFGVPLTEALALPVTRNGIVHHLLVQAFWRDAVVLDQSAQNASGQPLVSHLGTGVAYLRTVGPPDVLLAPEQEAWVQADTALLDAPGTGQQEAHIGQDCPLTLLGDASWDGGMLWYQVGWTTPHSSSTGWVEASDLTFTPSGSGPAWASIDALSPDLAAYLAAQGGNVGVAVYDVTRQRYYTSLADNQFITGSSIKVPIMLTLLDLTEQEGREPDSNELALLTTMIENSNNDSASALYYGEVGGAAGVAGYLQRIGISGLDADPNAFGWSLITPLAMVTLLTKLYEGAILTAGDRQLALSLMEQIEPDQQVGVGDTAPPGANVAMKDGWVTGPDGLWTMNSSGIVTVGSETYIIAVYTQGQNTLHDGQAAAQHVCATVAGLLT